MWSAVTDAFKDSPSQLRVVRFLLENGFGVNSAGKITANGIEMPATQVARAIGVDRRVVDTTARSILEDDALRDVFCNIRVTPDLSQVAEALGLAIITLIPKNAADKHIVSSAVSILADYDLSIRQLFVTDPIYSEEPRLVMIIDSPLPPGIAEDLRKLPHVKRLIL
ncbi:MAG: regulator of amino acid metabolism, contains ACT domain protein [Methanocalculus sp. MSAO_Arc1]|uniref:regulator of amino acid metabolism, contains ACT domain protein n=1 Tax=Methanocalculus TaxID=71151 RepID=UPI000FF56519|nr:MULTISPECIES: regulator of amino acid metabolism, contains ACT domain protein [unclassified Methanocalculus]MCP1662768.1 putative regulator of amino acid metabolism with ACT domain [Methanocalculus sp. AMF5]RQD79177.1 MAG: regulator of amino acid metabolism, contains ACT domain protein [Methanocalculus sp. MSAO_Arc1]